MDSANLPVCTTHWGNRTLPSVGRPQLARRRNVWPGRAEAKIAGSHGASGFVRRKWAWLEVDGARVVVAVAEIARVLAGMHGLPERSRVVLQAAAGARADGEALLPAEGVRLGVLCAVKLRRAVTVKGCTADGDGARGRSAADCWCQWRALV